MIRLVFYALLARIFARLFLAAYGTPTDPVSISVITVAYAIANLLNPIRALRAFTGGADPPGSGYVVTSDSTSTTSWKTLAAAVLAGIGYTPANKAGDTFAGAVVVAGNFQVGGTSTMGAINSGGISAASLTSAGALNVGGTSTMGAINAGGISGSVGVFSGAVSGTTGTFSGNVSGADFLVGGFSVKIPLGAVVWFETLAELTAAGAAWARYTAADGRFLMGASAGIFGVAFTEATNYGSSWTPAGSVGVSSTLGVNAGTLDVGGSLANAPQSNAYSGGAFSGPSIPHTHDISGLTVTGSPALSGSVSASGTSTVWIPPARAGIWGRRVA